MKQKIRSSLILVVTALIWGVAFVAQSEGGDAVGPYTFNCVRMLLGALALVPAILLLDRVHPTGRKPKNRQEHKQLWLGGITCGLVLFISSNLQQVGIYLGTPSGKAGFLTACYILIVPIMGIFLKRKCGWNVWIGVVLALAGLYLLCMKGSFGMVLSDGLVLLCAVCFSVHILVVDYFAPKVDGVRLSCIQFITAGVLGILPTVILEMGDSIEDWNHWLVQFADPGAWISILYAGLLSCGVAYTLQIIGQDGCNPTIASLIMSLESVFSVLAGWLILQEKLSAREIAGCIILFSAIILAQLEFSGKKGKGRKTNED